MLRLDKGAELRRFRWEEIAVVFQSAMNALNPVIDIRGQLTDTLAAHRREMSRDATKHAGWRSCSSLSASSVDRLRSFPHQLSGGMRQRVMIAMALALGPDLIIMDEPTTALDVVTQRQILEKIAGLRKQFGFAMVFITHDLSLLLDIADSIAIMYAGRMVERGPASDIYRHPAHRYTAGLLRSFPPCAVPVGISSASRGFPPICERYRQGAGSRRDVRASWKCATKLTPT